MTVPVNEGEGKDFPKKDGDKAPAKDPKAPKKGDGEDDLEDDKISESFLKLFDGLELSEEFKTKAKTIFMAAVHEESEKKAKKVKEKAEEEYEKKMEEAVSEMSTNVDKYLTHAVRQYLSENKIAIETGIQVEAATKVHESVKTIFESAGLDVPESDRSALAESQEELARTKTKLDEALRTQINLTEDVAALQRDKILGQVSEGLVLTDGERLKKLAESVEFVTSEQFTTEVKTLRESFIDGKPQEPVAKPNLNEGKPVPVEPNALDEGAQEPTPRKRRF